MNNSPQYFQPKCVDTKEVTSCAAEKAQEFCNFIMFTPTELPPALILKEQNLRKEAGPNIRSSYRQVFEGTERTLVVKQFLYDWAPPAYDYPCLWRNKELATTQESPAPRAVFINNHALWFGKNYRKQDAATIEMERTRIEITFEKGKFSDNEIIALCEGLQPVNPEARNTILHTPFSHLSYCFRHSEKASIVPLSYWRHTRDEILFCFSLTTTEAETMLEKFAELKNTVIAINEQGYRLDSAFGFGHTRKAYEEIELLFEHQSAPGSFIRTLYTPVENTHSIKFPPELGDQECTSTLLTTRQNHVVHYAHSNQFNFGQHELVFNVGRLNVLTLVKPAPWTSQKWLQELVENLFE